MRIRMTPQTLLCVPALETLRPLAYRRDMPDDLSTRIQSIRRKLGMNQADFGKALGVNQATVSRWEKGSIPDGVMMKRIAEIGGLDVTALIDGDMQAAKNGPQLYIKGEVAAGVWREALQWDQGDWVPYQGGSHFDAPEDARFGLKVVGESMNEVYPPGTILDCVATLHADIRAYQSGQRVIVCRKRWSGEVEATVKELLFDGDQVWLLPKSRNPAFQSPILLNGPDDDIEETCIVAVVKGSYRPE